MKRILFLLLLFLCKFMGVHSQESRDTIVIKSVEDALEMAREHNVERAIYDYQQEKAKKEHQLSKSYLLPTITGNFSAQNNLKLATTPIPGELVGQPGELVNVQFGQDYNYNTGLTATQTVFDWQSNMQSKIAKVGVQVAQVESELFDEKLKEQVALYYYTALISKKAVEINKKDRSVADSIQELTYQKFNKGLLDRLSLNQAVINLNNIEQNVWSNQRMLEQALTQLSILLGTNATIVLEGQELMQFDFPVAGKLSPDKNIELYDQQAEQSRLNLRQQQATYLPKLTFVAYFGQQQFQNDFTFSLDGNAWTDYSYLGLNLSFPLFTGLANRNRTKIAKIEHAIAQKRLEDEKRQSALRDALLLKEYDLSLYASSSAYDNFMRYRNNASLSLQKYEQGIISLDAYFKVFEDYLRSENNYLSALTNVYSYYSTLLSRKNDSEL